MIVLVQLDYEIIQYNTFAGVVTITLFQDADYGGKAIAFYFPQYIYTYDRQSII
ncbi:MAG: hypothetical protein R2739_09115 [Chitinophagales bacterium]